MTEPVLERPLARIPADHVLGRLLRAADKHKAALAGVFICLFYAAIIINVFEYAFWRHDSIRYIPHYYFKLVHDGRWGNTLFFPILKALPGWLSWAGAFAALFWFFYFVSRRAFTGSGRVFAFAAAAVMMASPALYSQLNWPATTLPATLVLAASTCLVGRARYIILVPFLSIILFGMYQWAIYLLPLLYLDRRFPSLKEAAIWWAQFVAVWGASFVAGYLFAQSVLHILTGSGIQVAWFRHPHPATDAGTFFVNLWANIEVAADHLIHLVPAAPLLLLLGLAAAFRYRHRQTAEGCQTALVFLAIGCMVAFSHYVATAPIGIWIEYRSVFPLHVGLALMFLSLAFIYNRATVMVTAVILIGLPAWYASYRNVAWFSGVSSKMRHDVRDYVPARLKARHIIVDATRHSRYYRFISADLPQKYGPFFERLDGSMRWSRALTEEGFVHAEICPAYPGTPLSENCIRVIHELKGGVCDSRAVPICVVEKPNEVLLRLQEP